MSTPDGAALRANLGGRGVQPEPDRAGKRPILTPPRDREARAVARLRFARGQSCARKQRMRRGRRIASRKRSGSDALDPTPAEDVASEGERGAKLAGQDRCPVPRFGSKSRTPQERGRMGGHLDCFIRTLGQTATLRRCSRSGVAEPPAAAPLNVGRFTTGPSNPSCAHAGRVLSAADVWLSSSRNPSAVSLARYLQSARYSEIALRELLFDAADDVGDRITAALSPRAIGRRHGVPAPGTARVEIAGVSMSYCAEAWIGLSARGLAGHDRRRLLLHTPSSTSWRAARPRRSLGYARDHRPRPSKESPHP